MYEVEYRVGAGECKCCVSFVDGKLNAGLHGDFGVVGESATFFEAEVAAAEAAFGCGRPYDHYEARFSATSVTSREDRLRIGREKRWGGDDDEDVGSCVGGLLWYSIGTVLLLL